VICDLGHWDLFGIWGLEFGISGLSGIRINRMNTAIKTLPVKFTKALMRITWLFWHRLHRLLTARVYLGRDVLSVPAGSVVFFPLQSSFLCCGIAAIVAYKNGSSTGTAASVALLEDLVKAVEDQGCQACHQDDLSGLDERYLGGKDLIESLWRQTRAIKGEEQFFAVYTDPNSQPMSGQMRAAWRRLQS
jgi:hypothetical protein